MNIPDRLTTEEREFAELLGRRDLADGPSPELDAAIKAMAAAALSAPAFSAAVPVPLRARRRRRPLAMVAMAASMVLAVGIAWQLRPLAPERETPEILPANETPAPSRAVHAPAPAPADVVPAATSDVPTAGAVAADPQPPRAEAPAPVPRAARTVDSSEREAAAAVVGGVEQPAAKHRLAPIDPPMLPAPSAPMVAPALKSAPLPRVASESTRPTDRKNMLGDNAMQRDAYSQVSEDGLHDVVVTGSRQVFIDIESDAALPQRQWLQRIRERQRDGDVEGARVSLRRFVAEYPKAHIPRTLRPLLQD